MSEQRRCYSVPKKVSVQQVVADLGKMGYRYRTEGIGQYSYTYYDTQDGRLYDRALMLRLSNRDADRGAIDSEGAGPSGAAPTWQLLAHGKLLLTQVTDSPDIPDVGVIADHIAGMVARGSLHPYLMACQTEQELSLYVPNPDRDMATKQGGSGTVSENGDVLIEQPMMLRFEYWSFKSPFGGEWSDPQMLMMVDVDDEGNELEYLHTLLHDLVGLVPMEFEPLSTGLDAIHAAPPGVPVPDGYRLSSADSVYTAIAKVVGKQRYKMWGNTDGTVQDLDIEFLHDLRVATRRARFALLLFQEYIGKPKVATLRNELSWIAKSLGKVRDIDVFQEKFSEQFRKIGASEEIIVEVVGHYTGKRDKNLESMKRDLQSERYRVLLEDLKKLEEFMMQKGRDQGVPVVELVPEFIRAVLDRMSAWLDRSADTLSPSDLHELRIEFKGLRYTTEFFGDLYAGEMRKVIKGFVQFQDCLGLFQDAQVASQTLRKFSAKSMKKGTATVDVMLGVGGLIQLQREIQDRQQARFLGMWNTFPRQIRDLRKLLQTGKYYERA
jgi:CHAD domain-containing protein